MLSFLEIIGFDNHIGRESFDNLSDFIVFLLNKVELGFTESWYLSVIFLVNFTMKIWKNLNQ